MELLDSLFELLDPVMGVFGVFIMVGTYYAAGGSRVFLKVIALILLGTIVWGFMLGGLIYLFDSISPKLSFLGVILTFPIFGFLLWKIGPKLFPEDNKEEAEKYRRDYESKTAEELKAEGK